VNARFSHDFSPREVRAGVPAVVLLCGNLLPIHGAPFPCGTYLCRRHRWVEAPCFSVGLHLPPELAALPLGRHLFHSSSLRGASTWIGATHYLMQAEIIPHGKSFRTGPRFAKIFIDNASTCSSI